ncbi:MAG: hypothetical protein ACKOFB_06035, partial [bacterium]
MRFGIHSIMVILAYVLCASYSFAQAPIAAIIPDLCTPGLNTALEIMAPAASKGAFGSDGVYLNNPGDVIRVKTLRDADSNMIVFSPLIVSWDGRLISVQAFVPPKSASGPNPNSWDWTLLQDQFRIPICVMVNGIQSAVDTIYIVQPFNFGDRSTDNTPRKFGDGTWGKRSRRGAMLVDSIILPANKIIEVSTDDCDPKTEGNQGYLPFTLMVQGNVNGNGSTISVNAVNQNGGPGGGGGAGTFCDFVLSNFPGVNAGSGYTGGAPAGVNSGKIYRTRGNGTGSLGIDEKISGGSITGIRGGECRAAEGGGGGT